MPDCPIRFSKIKQGIRCHYDPIRFYLIQLKRSLWQWWDWATKIVKDNRWITKKKLKTWLLFLNTVHKYWKKLSWNYLLKSNHNLTLVHYLEENEKYKGFPHKNSKNISKPFFQINKQFFQEKIQIKIKESKGNTRIHGDTLLELKENEMQTP